MTNIPVNGAPDPKRAACFSTLLATISPMDDNDEIFLNDIVPSDKQKRYAYPENIKKWGLPHRTTLLSHAPGGNVGNLHFLWKTPSDASGSDKATNPARITAKIVEHAPCYHTRQMRREFRESCNLLADVKPMYLRNI